MSAGSGSTAARSAQHDAEPLWGAVDFLLEASTCIDNRAQERDHADGERSMVRAVDMFNAFRGDASGALGMLSEVEGWVFMALLKLARSRGGRYQRDDFVDATAYLSLSGEAAEREAAGIEALNKAAAR